MGHQGREQGNTVGDESTRRNVIQGESPTVRVAEDT